MKLKTINSLIIKFTIVKKQNLKHHKYVIICLRKDDTPLSYDAELLLLLPV